VYLPDWLPEDVMQEMVVRFKALFLEDLRLAVANATSKLTKDEVRRLACLSIRNLPSSLLWLKMKSMRL
jgi:hypothetical protein